MATHFLRSIRYAPKQYTNLIKISSLLLCLFFLGACKDFLEVGTPQDRIVAEDVFNTPETATSAVLGIYSQFMGTSLWYSSGGMTIFTGLSSDELYNTNSSNTSYNELRTNSLTPQNGILDFNIWDRAYKNIYQANICIEKLQTARQLPSQIREQLLGESFFSRAFIYFYLINIFGDVPLILSTDYEVNSVKKRDEVRLVYDQIIKDLQEAKTLLKNPYVTQDRVRPNLKTAQALLARAYLYTKQWDLAITESTEIIESGLYSTDSLSNVFTIGSNETIWQLMPSSAGWNTTEARMLLPLNSSSSSVGQMALTEDLYNSFDPGDSRREQYIFSKTVNGNSLHFARKYKAVAIGTVSEYYKVFRLAEQYLIRAEAHAQKNNIPQAVADLNILRDNAHLNKLLVNDISDIFMVIEKERRSELFAEWGHRWFDLKRTGRALKVLLAKHSNIQEMDLLYPIPTSVLRANPFITQNKGYE